jgi:hypothetical protein
MAEKMTAASSLVEVVDRILDKSNVNDKFFNISPEPEHRGINSGTTGRYHDISAT